MSARNIAILGSTGSVGKSTLDVISRNPEKFNVVALGVRKSVDDLLEQINQFTPSYVVVTDEHAAKEYLKKSKNLIRAPQLLIGDDGLEVIASLEEVDCVMAAIVGGAGLLSTLKAAKSGKTVLLANKEALVMAGELLITEAKNNNATLLPIDSEHNAVFQCMQNIFNGDVDNAVQRITLTASGGPFLRTPIDQLEYVTPDQACAHPNWKMGRKISVDSATMMNKGLEVIEACLLFGVNVSNVNVVIHPQSIVHAMVAYKDGSMLSHMGYPDMRVPISHAIAWPLRIESGVAELDITECDKLEFFAPDYERFPCLQMALEVQKTGGSAPAIMNAANEVAVQSFLENEIKFSQIFGVVSNTIESVEPVSMDSVQSILQIDRAAREVTKQHIQTISG